MSKPGDLMRAVYEKIAEEPCRRRFDCSGTDAEERRAAFESSA